MNANSEPSAAAEPRPYKDRKVGLVASGLYRLQPSAWWVAVLFTLVAGGRQG